MQHPVRTNISAGNRSVRMLWSLVWLLLYRPSPRPLHGFRRVLLRLFGARIAASAHPYPSVRIWAPWNLEMDAHSCLADHVDCYCVARIHIGKHATVSQYSYLCSASHDYMVAEHPLIAAPILIEPHAWVAADVFVGPGVTIGAGAVVGARSTITRDVQPWAVVAGNPALKIKDRPQFSF